MAEVRTREKVLGDWAEYANEHATVDLDKGIAFTHKLPEVDRNLIVEKLGVSRGTAVDVSRYVNYQLKARKVSAVEIVREILPLEIVEAKRLAAEELHNKYPKGGFWHPTALTVSLEKLVLTS